MLKVQLLKEYVEWSEWLDMRETYDTFTGRWRVYPDGSLGVEVRHRYRWLFVWKESISWYYDDEIRFVYDNNCPSCSKE